MTTLLSRSTRAILGDPRIWASLLAMLLLLASVFLAWQSERQYTLERAHQVDVQARILSGSIAGALAFDDRETAREYLDALQLNPDIRAAAIYGVSGELIAGYVKYGPRLPTQVAPHRPIIDGLDLTVVQPVKQDKLRLGAVYIRTTIEPWSARFGRYFGIGAIVLLAAILIASLGRSYSDASAANRRLQREIAAREEAESKLHQAQKMEAMGQLTGGVAHDFNNLIMAASSGLELFERTQDADRREMLAGAMREALDRGAKLTQQLLAFSRKAPLQKEVVDLHRRFKDLAQLLEHSLRADITVAYEIAADVWPVEVDPSEFDVAILNVAVNARDAMPKAGTLKLSARNEPEGLDGHDAVSINITDTGLGMSRDQIEQAFEPFFTTKEVGKGTGLGLSQVYGFVRSSGGVVAIESEEGVGTTLSIVLPRSEQPLSPQGGDDTSPADQPKSGCRVLLVEDDEGVAHLLTEMLNELGCRVVRAATAEDALRIFDRASVELVLSDMVMPGSMDGLDLARQLRSQWPDLPVLLMTGHSLSSGPATAEGFDMLLKPFSLGELSKRMQKIAPTLSRPG